MDADVDGVALFRPWRRDDSDRQVNRRASLKQVAVCVQQRALAPDRRQAARPSAPLARAAASPPAIPRKGIYEDFQFGVVVEIVRRCDKIEFNPVVALVVLKFRIATLLLR